MAGSVSLEQKVSLPLLLMGTVMLVITVAEPYWFHGSIFANRTEFGLWKICGENDTCVAFDDWSGWITGPEVLECISMSCAGGALALSFKMIFQKDRLFCFLAAASATLSGILGLAGAMAFDRRMDTQTRDWCFYLNLVADIFIFISGAILVLHFFIMTRLGYFTLN